MDRPVNYRQFTEDTLDTIYENYEKGVGKVNEIPRGGWVKFDSDIEHDIKIVNRLKEALETPEKVTETVVESKEKDEPQEIQDYAETLHDGLKIMWVPMVYLGRMPFRLLLKGNKATIVVKKLSPAYIVCFTTCVLTWLLFLWITFGISLLVSNKGSKPKKLFMKHYWLDIFVFWTTLLQACVSTTHVIYQAQDFAMFIKTWYRVLDITKIEVSRTLRQYIIFSQLTLVLFILAMVVMFCFPAKFDSMQGTTWLIVLAIHQPIHVFQEHSSEKTDEIEEIKKLAHSYAPGGLFVYIIAIVFSWLYMMQFMVFCRCFRKGLKCINERIAMILNVDDVQRVGPNAVRLTYEYIHKDYLGIATTGMKIGRIFSWTACNYYLWAILVLVMELGEIFRFAKEEREKNPTGYVIDIMNAGKSSISIPTQQISNEILHVVVTTVCIFYVSYEGSAAHREGKMSYEYARYKGLVDCSTQLERNFIRSIWIIVSDKCPVDVSPGKFFGITHSTLMTVFATAFTYFIFWAQSRGGHFGDDAE